MKKRYLQIMAIALIMGLMSLALFGCGGAQDENKITIGSKNFTENIIMAEMMAQLIEAKTDLTVDRKLNLGGTLVCWNALTRGDLDLYPDYTGTGLMAILNMEVIKDPDQVYDIVQQEYNEQFEIKWLVPFGFNNTYAMAVKQEAANQYGLNKVSDLESIAGDILLGAEQEFLNRDDGYPGFIEAYGFRFKDVRAVETGLKYQAIANDNVEIINAFSTDGELITHQLTILEDDKEFFPPYFCAPVVRMDTLEKHPELEDVLNLLGGMITDDEMQQLNFQSKEERMDPAEVVSAFLNEKGLLD